MGAGAPRRMSRESGPLPWPNAGAATGQGPVVSELEELVETPAAPAAAPATRSVPRVRTLLVCDLADSTALLERLGDSAAADLIRQHDRVARDLLHRHGGREIDKT